MYVRVFLGGAEGGNHDITVCYIHTCIWTQWPWFCHLGLNQEGIFRISGNHKVVESLKATYDRGNV